MDCNLPGSSVRGILQARMLDWAATPFFRGSSWPRDRTRLTRIVGRFFTVWANRATWHPPLKGFSGNQRSSLPGNGWVWGRWFWPVDCSPLKSLSPRNSFVGDSGSFSLQPFLFLPCNFSVIKMGAVEEIFKFLSEPTFGGFMCKCFPPGTRGCAGQALKESTWCIMRRTSRAGKRSPWQQASRWRGPGSPNLRLLRILGSPHSVASRAWRWVPGTSPL